MACNGWNHPPGCNCDFSGGNNVPFPQNTYTPSNQNLNVKAGYGIPNKKSFTVPNARCPVCEQLVFFHSASNGGRVYFDALGPPWPKHPCTNADKHVPILLNKNERKGIRPIQPWKDKGWYLFKMPEPKRISKLLCMIELYHQGKDKRFYIPYHVTKILPDQAIHALDDEAGNTISLSFIHNGRPRYKKLFFFSIQADLEAKKMVPRRNKSS